MFVVRSAPLSCSAVIFHDGREWFAVVHVDKETTLYELNQKLLWITESLDPEEWIDVRIYIYDESEKPPALRKPAPVIWLAPRRERKQRTETEI